MSDTITYPQVIGFGFALDDPRLGSTIRAARKVGLNVTYTDDGILWVTLQEPKQAFALGWWMQEYFTAAGLSPADVARPPILQNP